MVEGQVGSPLYPRQPLLTNLNNTTQDGLQIIQQYLSGYPQGRDVLRSQEIRTSFVSLRSIHAVMCGTVHFYREPYSRAVEIQNIWTRWVLATIFETARSLAQLPPEERFRQAHLTSQLAREFYTPDRAVDQNPLPTGEGDHPKDGGAASRSPCNVTIEPYPSLAPPPTPLVPLPVPGRNCAVRTIRQAISPPLAMRIEVIIPKTPIRQQLERMVPFAGYLAFARLQQMGKELANGELGEP